MTRAQLIRQLVLDSQYVIDEEVVAAAILARGAARTLICEAAFRNDTRGAQVRSFRPTREARSFRPCNLQPGRHGRPMQSRRQRDQGGGR